MTFNYFYQYFLLSDGFGSIRLFVAFFYLMWPSTGGLTFLYRHFKNIPLPAFFKGSLLGINSDFIFTLCFMEISLKIEELFKMFLYKWYHCQKIRVTAHLILWHYKFYLKLWSSDFLVYLVHYFFFLFYKKNLLFLSNSSNILQYSSSNLFQI